MMELKDKFIRIITKYKLVVPKDKILLGVSGGPDSVCMLKLFSYIRKEYKLNLFCAHFNHQLRDEADMEEEFVKQLCENEKIKFISHRRNIQNLFYGDSLEQTARNLRFDFFYECCRNYRVKKVALAHNKDDVVETVLMRIIRGTALRGLRSIVPISKMKRITFIRPLIEIEKKEILEWLRINNIDFCVDKSNFEEDFLRNRIRMKLIPILKEFNPSFTDVVYNLAYNVGMDYDFIHNYVLNTYQKIGKQRGRNYVKLKLSDLIGLHISILHNIIRIAVEDVKGNLRRVEQKHMDEIIDLIIRRPKFSIVHLPQLEIKKDDNWLVIKSLIL